MFTTFSAKRLAQTICQRCDTMRRYNLALDAAMSPEDYRRILARGIMSRDRGRDRGLVLLVLDILDFPNTLILDEISALIGQRRPLYIVANKVRSCALHDNMLFLFLYVHLRA